MRKGGKNVPLVAIEEVMNASYPLPGLEVLRVEVERVLERDIRQDEMIYLREGADLASAVTASAALLLGGILTVDSLYEVLAKVASEEDLAEPEGLRESVAYTYENLDAVGRRYSLGGQVDALAALIGPDVPPSIRKGLNRTAASLLDTLASVPASVAGEAEVVDRQKLTLDVTGTPLVYEGMNRSVQKNQEQSLLISMTLVFLALAVFFRRIGVALVASVPAGFTLLVTFGVMGAFDIPMDVGTSMMTSIALGIGIDYAVHFIWHYGTPTAEEAPASLQSSMQATGWGIVINALEVAIGFGLLALGNIVPMRNVGLLTALAMVVSALATLILIPGLLRWFGPIFSLRSSTS
jgi:predicted RND superfamily exporter protein